ncbi:type IV toxin-antitoxin system AbiEi family antitoxin domain-containing protein [Candidatus Harpocratesius sp.]
MNRYELFQKLEKTKKNVFTPRELSHLAGIKPRSAYVLINRMKQKQQIYSVYKGKFALIDDPLLIATQLYQPSYFSLTTALFLHNRFDQIINDYYVITSKKIHSPTRILNQYNVYFLKIKPTLIFGYRKIFYRNSFYLVADLEKAVLDALYLPSYIHINDLLSALQKGFNLELIERYALQMKSEAVISRLGVLLDYLEIPTSLKRKSTTVYKLVPDNSYKGVFNHKWRIYVNKELGVDNQ